MGTPLKVLIVEDSENDAQLIVREIRRGGYEVEWERVQTHDSMRSALKRKDWNLIMCDHSLPQFNSLNALEVLHESGQDLPFIIASGSIGEEAAVEYLKAGAHDFVNKDKLARLLPAIERELDDAEARRQRKQAETSLIESEQRYRALFEDSPISLWEEDFSLVIQKIQVLKREGVANFKEYFSRHPEVMTECVGAIKVWDVNNYTLKLYEAKSKTELIEKLAQIFAGDDKGIERELTAIAEGRRFFEMEIANRTLTGKLIYVHLSWRVLSGYEETMSKVIVSIIDVTNRKRDEEKIRQHLGRLTALNTIDQAINSSFDLQLSFSVLFLQAANQLEIDAIDVLLFNPNTNMLEFLTEHGFHTSPIEQANFRLDQVLPGRAFLSNETVSVPNLLTSVETSLRLKLVEQENFIAYYAVPLIVKGKIKGMLEVFHRSPLKPDREWLDFLNTLAEQAAIAIDNFQLFEGLHRSNSDLHLAYERTIEGWSHALDLRDKETEGHTQRVTEITLRLAREAGMIEEELVHVRRGALLHDIGKMGVPDSILLKPDSLTEEEWGIMRKHPQFAHDLLSPIEYLHSALDIPYCHHEKWDGTGYPRQLKGEQIPLSARLFAVVDVWDAIRSDRPYRKAWPEEKAREYIRLLSGTHFDPHAVEPFFNTIR